MEKGAIKLFLTYILPLSIIGSGVIFLKDKENEFKNSIKNDVETIKKIENNLVSLDFLLKDSLYSKILSDTTSYKNYLEELESRFEVISLKRNQTRKDNIEQETLRRQIDYGRNKYSEAIQIEMSKNSVQRKRDSLEKRIDSVYGIKLGL